MNFYPLFLNFGIRNLNITPLGEYVEHRESQRRIVRSFLKAVIEISFTRILWNLMAFCK